MARLLPILVAFLLASACGAGGEGGATADDAGPAVTTGSDGVEERPEILRLASLETLDGEPFDPNSVAGVDVLLWFWGPH